MDKQRNQRGQRLAAVIMMALALLMTTTVLSAPGADAHSGKFEHDDARFVEDGCDEDAVPNGETGEIFGRQILGCTHEGYVLIGSDVPLCEEARGVFVEDVCTFDRARPCDTRPDFLYAISDGMCIRPAMVLAEFGPVLELPPASRSLTPVCVETKLVQDNAYSNFVGDTFSQGSRDYLIVTGDSCTFNCHDGWDINCDGKLGDFCPSELDLANVVDVGTCMAANIEAVS